MSSHATAYLTHYLSSHDVKYTILSHSAEGKSEEVAQIRGTHVGQGAKALVCKVKEKFTPQYVLAIVPGDTQLDFKQLAQAVGAKKISMASVDDVYALTQCIPGTVPPFSFHDDLKLVADPSLFERFDTIAFNACALDRSILLASADYLKLTTPLLVSIIKSNPVTS